MKKINFLYILAVSTVLFSCKKQLSQNDPESIDEDKAFQTIEHVQQGVNGAYGGFATNINDVYKSALVSDEAKIGPDNNGQGALTYRFQYSADNTTGGDVISGYGGYYAMIDQVNRVLPHVYEVTGNVSQARRDELRGQLLALRGLAHFHLLRSFAKNYDAADTRGIAVVTVSDPTSKPVRATMAEAVTAIEKDLADAKALMPAVTAANFSDTIMNRINVTAFQARIALWKRDYPAAITFATEVINSNAKPLLSGTDFQDIWNDLGETSNGLGETLFRIRLLQSASLGSLWTTTSNLIYISPSDKLVGTYSADDIRLDTYFGDQNGNNYVKKHYVSNRGGRIVDHKVIRIAEIYLIRAEAYARQATPNVTLGAADLNLVRSNRISPYTNETFGNAADLASAVLMERFKELCFEGHRFFDLKRNNLPVQRNASDANAEWQTLAANSHRFVFPIPQDAILANPNMVQNDGY